MKLFIVLLMLMFAVPAVADPQCDAYQNPYTSQPPTLDLSAGTFSLCAPWRDENGNALPAGEVIDCMVSFQVVDGSTASMAISGLAAGEYRTGQPLPSSALVSGDMQAVCTGSTLPQGGTGNTVAATFPAPPAPAGIRPAVLLP